MKAIETNAQESRCDARMLFHTRFPSNDRETSVSTTFFGTCPLASLLSVARVAKCLKDGVSPRGREINRWDTVLSWLSCSPALATH